MSQFTSHRPSGHRALRPRPGWSGFDRYRLDRRRTASLRARVDAWWAAEAAVPADPSASGSAGAERAAGAALARVFDALPGPQPSSGFARRVLRRAGLSRDLQGVWRWFAFAALAVTVLGGAGAFVLGGWRPIALEPSAWLASFAQLLDLSGRGVVALGGAVSDLLVLALRLGRFSPYLGAALLVLSTVVFSLTRLAWEWFAARRRPIYVV